MRRMLRGTLTQVQIFGTIVAVLLVTALWGCTSLQSDYITAVRGNLSNYSPSYTSYAFSAGEVNTLIFGSAFDMPQAAFEEMVTDPMHGRPFWAPSVRYTTQPSDAASDAFYVVLTFNPPDSYDGYDACAKRELGGEATGPHVRVVGAFCSNVKLLSEVRASASGVTGPEDGLFARLVQRVVIELFPPRPLNIGPDIILLN